MSWVEDVWAAQRRGLLSSEEAWQVLLDARDAPDPARVVARVLRGLAHAHHPPPPVIEPEEIVIEDVPEA
jgi:hypothetical protein